MVAVVIAVVVLLVVAGAIAFASIARRTGRTPVPVNVHERPVAPPEPSAQSPNALPAPLFDLNLEPAIEPAVAAIRWYTQFDARSRELDDTARLRLIGDLGVVAKEWCVPLLCAAYEEERRPANRQAALIGLTACRSVTAVPTFRLALDSGDAQERAIAADGLADLEPPAKIKQRPVVERR